MRPARWKELARALTAKWRLQGDSVELSTPKSEGLVAADFNANEVEQAAQQAQANAPGDT